MPKALQADWELIKTRYITGSLPKELSQEFDVPIRTINKRITRGKWVKLKTAIRRNVADLVRMTLEEASKQAKQNLAHEVAERTQALKRVPAVDTLADIGARASVASELAGVGSKVFGWGDETGMSIMSVTALSSEPTELVFYQADPPALPISQAEQS